VSKASKILDLVNTSSSVKGTESKKPYHTDITGKKVKDVNRKRTITPGPPPGWKPGAR